MPLAKPTVSAPILFTAGLDTITFGTDFTSVRVSFFPLGPAMRTESVAPGLKCDVGRRCQSARVRAGIDGAQCDASPMVKPLVMPRWSHS